MSDCVRSFPAHIKLLAQPPEQTVDPQAIADAYTAYYSAPANESRKWVSYVDNATKGFLKNVQAGRKFPNTGAGDTETNAIAHVLPVVAMRAGRPSEASSP